MRDLSFLIPTMKNLNIPHIVTELKLWNSANAMSSNSSMDLLSEEVEIVICLIIFKPVSELIKVQ